jgi:hypothetical protein
VLIIAEFCKNGFAGGLRASALCRDRMGVILEEVRAKKQALQIIIRPSHLLNSAFYTGFRTFV